MKKRMKNKSLLFAKYLLLPLSLLGSEAVFAEISTLTQEELTDTYIKDTTVIVRPKKLREVTTTIPVTLKVTPLEQTTQSVPEDQTSTTSTISHELSTYDDLNNQWALENSIAPQLPPTTTEFITLPASEEALELIRSNYGSQQGVIDGKPIDLTTLPFLPNLQPANQGNIPAGSSYQTTDSSFTINIPNAGNIRSQQVASPNGEIGVNITPANIEYTINLPR